MSLHRRRFVRATATIGVAALAGCAGLIGDDATDTTGADSTDDDTTADTTTSTDTTAPTTRTTATTTHDTATTGAADPTQTSATTPTTTATATTTTSPRTSTNAEAAGSDTRTRSTTTTPGTNATTPQTNATNVTPATRSTTATNRSATTADSVAAEVEVAPGNKLVFSPESVEVAVGETVRWITRSTGHNVSAKPDANGTISLPAGADPFASYSGDNHYTALLEVDERYEHTFETPGDYTYVCVPHALQGMVGRVTVVE